MKEKIVLFVVLFLSELGFARTADAKVFVLVGPSGVGKSTLISGLRESSITFDELISHTTRARRQNEVDGKDYFFLNESEFRTKEAGGEFLISTLVHGNWYGIEKDYLDTKIRNSIPVVCSLNVDAALKIKSIYRDEVVTIFVAPPSFDELRGRLLQRSSEDHAAFNLRLKNAEIELAQQDRFDYKIVNDGLKDALVQLEELFTGENSLKLLVMQPMALAYEAQVLRTMSYNVRMAPIAEDDNGENAWIHRLPKVKSIVDHYLPGIIGLQEVSDLQVKTLDRKLRHLNYKFLARFPTRPPIESGLAIAYDSEKVELVSSLHTLWLNEVLSHSNASAWDGSAYERYVIYAKFRHRATQKEFWFVTTHFDHLGIVARQESAKIVMKLAETLNAPAVVTGDFNCFPQLGGVELYQLLISSSKHIKDSGSIARSMFGVPGTWMGWDYDPYRLRDAYVKYDFVFVHDSIEVNQQGILDDRVWDGEFQKELYPSDHRPVVSDLVL